MLYWNIGSRIQKDILHNQRGEYGKQVIKNLALQLTAEFSNGWSLQNLRHCLRSVEAFSLFTVQTKVIKFSIFLSTSSPLLIKYSLLPK